MQNPDASHLVSPPTPDSIDLVTQTRSLRRKVIFWRRTAWMLLGGLAIVAVILWQRGEQHRRTCRLSLAQYYEQARKLKLSAQPLDLLESEWRRSLKAKPELLSPFHYNLIARNWQTTPADDESLPLAVCREPHTLGFSSGRNVLYQDGHIEWLTESKAAPIVRAAEHDDEH